MTVRDEINNEYFEWMYNIVCASNTPKDLSYRKLLGFLHDVEFVYSMQRDGNRAKEGINLRYRFVLFNECEDLLEYLDGPCSILEMMLALAIHCEENIMDDPNIGDRTAQWFWGMVVNLGLGSMDDDRFDKGYAEDVILRFLNRDYEYDGKGGLFRVKNTTEDMRNLEIWYQLCRYLGTIT